MNQEHSKIDLEEKPQNKTNHESLKYREDYNLSIGNTHWENSNYWYNEYPKSNDKIKNFLTFLKLIDEKMN
ncbi:MAG: hypothetical protein ABJB76_08020 [Candidatus Nitrosocosmicus sp.]